MNHNNYGTLPANNISQQLFQSQLQNCVKPYGENNWEPSPCCLKSHKLGQWYDSAPVNLWNVAKIGEEDPSLNSCTEEAFIKQCFLSQHYNYLSKNNTLN